MANKTKGWITWIFVMQLNVINAKLNKTTADQ